jgi:hypothetical protein
MVLARPEPDVQLRARGKVVGGVQEQPVSPQLSKTATAGFARNLAGDSKIYANAWKSAESIEFHGVRFAPSENKWVRIRSQIEMGSGGGFDAQAQS